MGLLRDRCHHIEEGDILTQTDTTCVGYTCAHDRLTGRRVTFIIIDICYGPLPLITVGVARNSSLKILSYSSGLTRLSLTVDLHVNQQQ